MLDTLAIDRKLLYWFSSWLFEPWGKKPGDCMIAWLKGADFKPP